jgi:hypothetical protein
MVAEMKSDQTTPHPIDPPELPDWMSMSQRAVFYRISAEHQGTALKLACLVRQAALPRDWPRKPSEAVVEDEDEVEP